MQTIRCFVSVPATIDLTAHPIDDQILGTCANTTNCSLHERSSSSVPRVHQPIQLLSNQTMTTKTIHSAFRCNHLQLQSFLFTADVVHIHHTAACCYSQTDNRCHTLSQCILTASFMTHAVQMWHKDTSMHAHSSTPSAASMQPLSLHLDASFIPPVA